MSDRRKAEKLWEELYNKYKNQPPINNTDDYYCSEWSWTPICDGYSSYQHEKYPYIQIKDGIVFYATGKNYRVYAIWDLYPTKEECDILTHEKNNTGYEWDILYNRKCNEYRLEAEPGQMKQLGWIKINQD